MPGASVLLCVDLFHPSVGDFQTMAEELGVALGSRGRDVEIATRVLPERHARRHRGMLVHEIAGAPAEQLRALVFRRRPAAVLALSSAIAWPVLAALALPAGPRVVVVAAVTPETDAHLRSSHDRLAQYRVLLDRADAVGHAPSRGLAAGLHADLGVRSEALPDRPPAGPDPGWPALAARYDVLLGGDRALTPISSAPAAPPMSAA